jgi:3,4-dihydroxy-2-butanone 4-phosphate synthase
MMVKDNQDSLKTAYTVSVDYKHGTTYVSINLTIRTGISAADRAATCRNLADPANATSIDFTRPGHVFPLRYVEGGVLKRVGHTVRSIEIYEKEASVDLCRLAGKYPCAVISEVVSVWNGERGEMARRDELREMAREWGVKVVSIADLVLYVREQEIKR